MRYKRYIVSLMLFAFMFCLISNTLKAQEEEEPAVPGMMSNPKMKSALMSALFPGLGQLKNNQKTKAYIFMGTGAVLLGTTVFMALSANKLWDDYANNRAYADFDTPEDRVRYDKYGKQADTTTIMLGLTLAFWTYNIVDAYLYAPKVVSSSEPFPVSEEIEKIEDEVLEEPEEAEEKVLDEPKDIEKEMQELEEKAEESKESEDQGIENEEPELLEEETIPAEETGEPKSELELEESTGSESTE